MKTKIVLVLMCACMLTGFASGLLAQHITGAMTGNAILYKEAPIEENIPVLVVDPEKPDKVAATEKEALSGESAPVEKTGVITKTKSINNRSYEFDDKDYRVSDIRLTNETLSVENDVDAKRAHEPDNPEEKGGAAANDKAFTTYGSNGITVATGSSEYTHNIARSTQRSRTQAMPGNLESARTADENIPIPELSLCARDYETGPDVGGTKDVFLPDLPGLE